MKDSFAGLQLDSDGKKPHMKASIGQDGMIDITAEQHIKALLRQLENGDVDHHNPNIKEQLQELFKTIQNI